MPNHVDPINTGDPIRAEWLNKVASQAGAFPVIHGRGYADSDGVAFAAGRSGVASREFYAKSTVALNKGPQVAGTTVAENKGPYWNAGSGEPTGETPEIHYLHVRDVLPDEWLHCKEDEYGIVYCGPIECP